MRKNYSELIANKQKKQLTAKGVKFVNRCIEIAASQRGLTRYHKEFKEVKNKLRNILYFLILDKEFSIEQIKEAVKNQKLIQDETIN